MHKQAYTFIFLNEWCSDEKRARPVHHLYRDTRCGSRLVLYNFWGLPL